MDRTGYGAGESHKCNDDGEMEKRSIYQSGWNVSSTSVLFQLKITCLFGRFLHSARFQFRSRHIFYIARANWNWLYKCFVQSPCGRWLCVCVCASMSSECCFHSSTQQTTLSIWFCAYTEESFARHSIFTAVYSILMLFAILLLLCRCRCCCSVTVRVIVSINISLNWVQAKKKRKNKHLYTGKRSLSYSVT